MKFPGAGYTTLAVIYSNGGSNDRMFNAYLDHDYYVNAPPTGSWDKWDTAYVVLDAPMGEADLRFISLTAEGGPNIDAFGFSLEGVCRVGVDCTTTKWNGAVTSTGVKLRGDFLQLASAERVVVRVFDMSGRMVAQSNFDATREISLSALVKNTGLYRIVVKQGNVKFNVNWAKVK